MFNNEFSSISPYGSPFMHSQKHIAFIKSIGYEDDTLLKLFSFWIVYIAFTESFL